MSATPPSIAIAAPVLGGPEVVRAARAALTVVFHSSSSRSCPTHADEDDEAFHAGGGRRLTS